MIFYRLQVAPSETDGEGEDHDRWFTSLRAARRVREELISEDPLLDGHRYGSDFAIERVASPRQLAPRKLALALLNRQWFAWERTTVVAAYEPPREDE